MKKPDTFWNIWKSIPRDELAKFVNNYTNLSQIVTVLGQTGLGRQAANNDKISGLLTYNASGPPSAFATSGSLLSANGGGTSNANVVYVTSLAQAVALGILQASGNYEVEYYHISEFFRINPNGWLYIGIYTTPGGSYTYAEISTMIQLAGGNIRQLAVYPYSHAYASADVTTIQAVWAALPAGFQQFSILFAPDFSGVTAITGWSGLTNLRTLLASKVSVCIAQDGGGAGAALFATKTHSITAVGALLGSVSAALVSQPVSCPALFPITNGVELNTLCLANGDLINAVGYSELDSLLGNGYTFARQYLPDLAGSYWENVPTAVPSTNNYAFMQIVRAIDKMIRGIRTNLMPYLNLNIAYNPTGGTITNDSIGFFTDLAQTVCDTMESNNEISAGRIVIDPTQNVFAANKLIITAYVVPEGSAAEFQVNIDLVTSLPTA